MSREIKFRSWNEEEKVFYYFSKGLVFDCPIKIKEYNHVGGNNFYKFNWDNAEQFTGLTDKNGKEIYEGDIVNYKTIVKKDETGENITYKGDIQFWSGQVGCGWRYKSGRCTLMIKRSHSWSMEVIGNIHEKTNKND